MGTLSITLFIIVFILLLIYYILYLSIKVQNTIYFDREGTQVVVLSKSLSNITISYRDRDPETISTLYFLLNYNEYI